MKVRVNPWLIFLCAFLRPKNLPESGQPVRHSLGKGGSIKITKLCKTNPISKNPNCCNPNNSNDYELRTTNYELFKTNPIKPNFTRRYVWRANPIYGEQAQRVEPSNRSNPFGFRAWLCDTLVMLVGIVCVIFFAKFSENSAQKLILCNVVRGFSLLFSQKSDIITTTQQRNFRSCVI